MVLYVTQMYSINNIIITDWADKYNMKLLT